MNLNANGLYDAIIVGARCAGAASALLLARAGLKVLAVDRSPEGSDALSTHALMRAGVLQLTRWGMLPEVQRMGTPPIRTTTFHYGSEALGLDLRPKYGVSALYAPRRRILDELLVRAARRAGAIVEHRTSVLQLLTSATGRIQGVRLHGPQHRVREVRAPLVIGADGLHSKVAQLVRAPYLRCARHASATIYGYFEGFDVDAGYHWHYGERVTAGTIPTSGNVTCVFAGLPSRDFLAHGRRGAAPVFKEALKQAAPALAHSVKRAKLVEPLRVFGGRAGFIRKTTGPGWALVGDAGCFKDPATANGMSDALRDAELLARAIVHCPTNLETYEVEQARIAHRFLALTDEIASFNWNLSDLARLHRALSTELNRHAELITGWDIPPNPNLPQKLPNVTLSCR